jgi:hypothetical protein
MALTLFVLLIGSIAVLTGAAIYQRPRILLEAAGILIAGFGFVLVMHALSVHWFGAL